MQECRRERGSATTSRRQAKRKSRVWYRCSEEGIKTRTSEALTVGWEPPETTETDHPNPAILIPGRMLGTSGAR